VTLEADVERQVRDLMRERGTGFKETINELLRRGLRAESVAPGSYEIPVFDAEIRPGIDLDKALALAAAMEDDEILRKVALGK
jgi:hypothetical protein